MTRPKVTAAWDSAQAEYVAALEADPLIGEALAIAAKAGGAERNRHVAFAASRLAPLAPSLPESEWRAMLRDGLAGVTLRTSVVPGIPGRVVWVVRDDADAAALRDAIGPGQVWVRTDLVRADDLATVWAHAMDAKELDIGTIRPAGRRKGSKNRARAQLLAAIRADPDMTTADIERLGIELGYCDQAVDDVEREARAMRLRRAARRINP